MIRGLVRHEWRAVVPLEYHVEAITVSYVGVPLFENILLMSPEQRVDCSLANGAFRYACTRSPEDRAFSAWRLELYPPLGVAGEGKEGELLRAYLFGITGPPEIKDLLKRLDRATA